jgi:hypothetical protein
LLFEHHRTIWQPKGREQGRQRSVKKCGSQSAESETKPWRSGGSKEHNTKKKTAATPPVEEVKEDDDNNDEEDVDAGADDDDNDDDLHVEDCNKEDEDDCADSAPDPIVESEGEEDENSNGKEIPRSPDRCGTQTSFSKQNVEKMNSRMNKGEER